MKNKKKQNTGEKVQNKLSKQRQRKSHSYNNSAWISLSLQGLAIIMLALKLMKK